MSTDEQNTLALRTPAGREAYMAERLAAAERAVIEAAMVSSAAGKFPVPPMLQWPAAVRLQRATSELAAVRDAVALLRDMEAATAPPAEPVAEALVTVALTVTMPNGRAVTASRTIPYTPWAVYERHVGIVSQNARWCAIEVAGKIDAAGSGWTE